MVFLSVIEETDAVTATCYIECQLKCLANSEMINAKKNIVLDLRSHALKSYNEAGLV